MAGAASRAGCGAGGGAGAGLAVASASCGAGDGTCAVAGASRGTGAGSGPADERTAAGDEGLCERCERASSRGPQMPHPMKTRVTAATRMTTITASFEPAARRFSGITRRRARGNKPTRRPRRK